MIDGETHDRHAESGARDPVRPPPPVADATDDAADEDGGAGAAQLGAQQAIYFYGVTRAKTWRAGLISQPDGDVLRVRYRDLEALVRAVPYALPSADGGTVQAHQRVVEGAMRSGTVLPAPFGIIFRGRRQLIRMMQDQYLVLDEGLSLLDGHWELRLHIAPASPGEELELELSDLAMQLYSELRRHARAAVPFAVEGRRLLSAAFLVERTVWIDFVDRAEDLASAHDDITFDITGPWPPYDFVRIVS